jgi:hypothetical protein
MNNHKDVTFKFDGELPPLVLSHVAATTTTPSSNAARPEKLIMNVDQSLTSDCHPIRIKSRKFNRDDERFIQQNIDSLLADGEIEVSNSPWRAQVFITKNERHKKRMVIDFSQTINRFTELDAYQFPCIDKMASEVTKYQFFSTLDLQSA